MIGINHYLTSERFLDHRTELYPGHEIGGNGRDRYVDAEAVRVKRLNGRTGIAERLKEVWKRYAIPLAITEVHHGCTREEQVRWLLEVWQAAKSVRQDGRSEEHTSELQSLMRISYAVFCLKKKKINT